MGAHYRSALRYDNKLYEFSEMSTGASQSESAAKNAKGTANMKKAPPKFKSSYASMITKAIKEMIEEGKLIPAAQAGHSGAGSFKISPQEKLRIKQGEKAAAKKEMKKAAGTKSADGAKKV